MTVLRTLYTWWATALLAAVFVQIGFAGYGAFFVADKAANEGDVVTHAQFEDGWELHTAFGYVVFLGGVVLLVLALLARVARPRVMLSLGIALLLTLQVLLAWFGSDAPVVGAFHPVNAVAIAALTGILAGRIRRRGV